MQTHSKIIILNMRTHKNMKTCISLHIVFGIFELGMLNRLVFLLRWSNLMLFRYFFKKLEFKIIHIIFYINRQQTIIWWSFFTLRLGLHLSIWIIDAEYFKISNESQKRSYFEDRWQYSYWKYGEGQCQVFKTIRVLDF